MCLYYLAPHGRIPAHVFASVTTAFYFQMAHVCVIARVIGRVQPKLLLKRGTSLSILA